jgi:hypothetical protein
MTEVLDDSWRARARDRMRPMTVGALIELLRKEDPAAAVLVDCAVPDNAVFPAGADHEHVAAATRVITLSPTELLICSDEG